MVVEIIIYLNITGIFSFETVCKFVFRIIEGYSL